MRKPTAHDNLLAEIDALNAHIFELEEKLVISEEYLQLTFEHPVRSECPPKGAAGYCPPLPEFVREEHCPACWKQYIAKGLMV